MHGKIPHILHKIMHVLEMAIAIITMVLLIGALVIELTHLAHDVTGYLSDAEHFLHHLLTIVVGLEFVKLLLDTTPHTLIEVLGVAIARHVVLSHEDPWSNLACIACIAGLMAVNRFLLPKKEKETEHAHH